MTGRSSSYRAAPFRSSRSSAGRCPRRTADRTAQRQIEISPHPDPPTYEPSLRQYDYQATDESLSALRRLRGAWSRVHIAETAVTVVLADGFGVCIQVEAADIEDAFEAFRLTATLDPAPMVYGDAMSAFAEPSNDIVLFSGATWSEQNAETREPIVAKTAVVSFSGHPGQLPDSAEIVCITTDAVVVATAAGVGMLIRTGLKPYSIDVVHDPAAVREFLIERGYSTDP